MWIMCGWTMLYSFGMERRSYFGDNDTWSALLDCLCYQTVYRAGSLGMIILATLKKLLAEAIMEAAQLEAF